MPTPATKQITRSVAALTDSVTKLIESVQAAVESGRKVGHEARGVAKAGRAVGKTARAKSAKLRKALRAYWARMKGKARRARIAVMLKGRGLKPRARSR
jgi:hypothetical protein